MPTAKALDFGGISRVGLDRGKLVEIVERITATAPETISIYVFGSRARGDMRPDSDIDLFVVIPDEGRSAWNRMGDFGVALFGIGIPKDVVCLHKSDFVRKAKQFGSFEWVLAREGVRIYG